MFFACWTACYWHYCRDAELLISFVLIRYLAASILPYIMIVLTDYGLAAAGVLHTYPRLAEMIQQAINMLSENKRRVVLLR